MDKNSSTENVDIFKVSVPLLRVLAQPCLVLLLCEVEALVQIPKFCGVASNMTNYFLVGVGPEVGPNKVLAICNMAGVFPC